MQGLGQAPCERCLKGDVPAIVEFVSSIGQDPEFDEEIVKIAVDLLGDLCAVIQVGGNREICMWTQGIPVCNRFRGGEIVTPRH